MCKVHTNKTRFVVRLSNHERTALRQAQGEQRVNLLIDFAHALARDLAGC